MWLIQLLLSLAQLSVLVKSGPNCAPFRDSLAESTSSFTSCAIRNSRPVKFCTNCIKSYLQIQETYQNMTDTGCINQYTNLDRLQIVQTLYSNSYSLWNEAKCDECFEINNGTLTPNRSKQAIKFDEYYNNYTNCLNSNSNETLCFKCLDIYVELDKYYHSISNENQKIAVCMDMVDLMNITRLYWSGKCCKYRRHPEYAFITSSVIVLVGTILFYVVVKLYSKQKSPTILQQRRFAESLSQNSNHIGQIN